MADGRLSGSCAHCELPLTLRRPAPGPVYCCLGCRLAATVAGGRDGQRQFLESRLLLASFLAMGVMTFTLVLYSTAWQAQGDEQGLGAMVNMGRALLALFALPVLLLLGPPLAHGAWLDLRAGQLRMDGLIVLATFAAYGLSVHATWTGQGEVYYETATMVLVLVTFGRRLEAHARTRGRDSAELLADWTPGEAHRLDEHDVEHDVAPEALVVGDRCRLRPGELVPADVVVLSGAGPVRCDHVTGEHAPRPARPGTRLPSGAVVGEAALVVRVERPAASSALARLQQLLDAPLTATRAMRLADRWAGALVALALLLATFGGIRSGLAFGAGAGLRTALAVLLVACPCALGLATPLAYRALRAALGRRGVLVHSADQLERAGLVDYIVYDKTGTLTRPDDHLVMAWSAGPPPTELLTWLMRASGHALGASLQAPSGGDASAALSFDELAVVPGQGVSARQAGRRVQAGRPEWLAGAAWPDAARQALSSLSGTVVALVVDGRPEAVAEVRQRLVPGARDVVVALRERGLPQEIVSGDRPGAVASLAADLDLPFHADCSPQDKLDRLSALQAEGRTVLVVGDGLNDAPLLRAADVAVSVPQGTAAARAHAGLELVGGLTGLDRIVAGARELRRTIRGNLAWTVAYNGVALALATSGHLPPVVAAAVMAVSSLCVCVRSHRLLDWEPPRAATLTDPAPTPPALPALGARSA